MLEMVELVRKVDCSLELGHRRYAAVICKLDEQVCFYGSGQVWRLRSDISLMRRAGKSL